MKKTALLAVALATCLAYVPARAADVVSANVVGYSKLTLRANGYTLIANPFVDVATDETIAINDMFAEDATAANAGATVTGADTLEVWTGNGYTSYFFFSRNGSAPYWMKSGDRVKTTDSIPEGEGAFYHNISSEPVTLTISGEVSAEDASFTIVPGYNLMANPFPTELSFTNFVVEGATAGATVTTADTIDVWNGNGYTSYFLFSRNGSEPYWMKSGDRVKTTDTIAPYTGFFYHSLSESGSFNITMPSPLK